MPQCPGAVGSATHSIQCLTAGGQRIMLFLQCTASLPGGSGHWDSCNALTHCQGAGAVRTAPPAMRCLIASGQWAVLLLQYTASLPRGIGQWNSCKALHHSLGVLGTANPAMHCLIARGSGQWNFCNALPHCLGAVGSATLATHCVTAWGQWAVGLLQYTASLPFGGRQWDPCNTLHTALRQ